MKLFGEHIFCIVLCHIFLWPSICTCVSASCYFFFCFSLCPSVRADGGRLPHSRVWLPIFHHSTFVVWKKRKSSQLHLLLLFHARYGTRDQVCVYSISSWLPRCCYPEGNRCTSRTSSWGRDTHTNVDSHNFGRAGDALEGQHLLYFLKSE